MIAPPIRWFLLTFLSCLLASHSQGAEASRPNIVVILCDDLGWGDLQNYGHPSIKTPHLMEMAAEGIRFTSFYSASPVCSPSRVGLLTGRNPNRAGVYDWIPAAAGDKPPKNSRNLVHMRPEEFTIAEMLKEAGYATCMSGKWHCNAMFNSEKQAQPGDHGFDYWFATQNNAAPSHENPVNFVRNGQETGPLKGYACQIVAQEAVEWIRGHHERSPDQPFFAYVAYHEPHEPVASPPDMVKKYESRSALNHDEAQYFANVENLDDATGKILQALEELGISDNTLVIFTSDNGPETLNRYRSANRSYGRPGPWRGMKLHTHEAGYRVAGIMRWPDQIKAGQISDEAVSSLDFLPTFATLAGATVPPDISLDGTDVSPLFSGKEFERSKPLVWLYLNAINSAKISMRHGNYKVLASLSNLPKLSQVDEKNIEQVRNAKLLDFEIYDLSRDPVESESFDPSTSDASAEDLPALLEKHFRELVDSFHVWPSVPSSLNSISSPRLEHHPQKEELLPCQLRSQPLPGSLRAILRDSGGL